ncbi:MAG TPA: tagatose 1,6-diphosphate aldolase [Chloroflexi bacterium]|nr:tagatose 1,6-diphosphate aldolase [Chloroflexota bacterium]
MNRSLGKIRRLQQYATPDGKFVMFALDHRGNLRRSLNPDAPESVTYEQMTQFKREVTAVMSPSATAVLLDPVYGVGPVITAGALAREAGLLLAVEKTGYTGDPTARQSQILPGWSVEKIARIGADGVKLLIYYHPDAPNAAEQEALVRQVGASCREYDIPFFLEPLSFSLDTAVAKLPAAEKRQVVIETARRMTPMGVDVLKAEFPVNIPASARRWMRLCRPIRSTGKNTIPAIQPPKPLPANTVSATVPVITGLFRLCRRRWTSCWRIWQHGRYPSPSSANTCPPNTNASGKAPCPTPPAP